MKRAVFKLIGIAACVGAIVTTAALSAQSNDEAAPIFGIKMPAGYRDWDWDMISIATVGAPLNDLRAKLGNDIAI